MQRFRSILVWLEASVEHDAALECALGLARGNGASLTLVHACEAPGRLFRTLHPRAEALHARSVEEHETQLEALAAPLRDGGLDVSARVLVGKPYLEVIRQVLRAGHDLVVKPAHTPAEGQRRGSSDMRLQRECPCALWLVQPDSVPAKRLLATVDPDPEGNELNRRILEMATSLAAMGDASLDLLHVWEPYGEEVLAPRVDAAELADYVERTRQNATREFEELLGEDRYGLPADRVHLLKGRAVEAIPDFVRRGGIDLVVMGTVSRAGIDSFLIGNTAETVLSRVHCSVLTVKPEGFVSPVRA